MPDLNVAEEALLQEARRIDFWAREILRVQRCYLMAIYPKLELSDDQSALVARYLENLSKTVDPDDVDASFLTKHTVLAPLLRLHQTGLYFWSRIYEENLPKGWEVDARWILGQSKHLEEDTSVNDAASCLSSMPKMETIGEAHHGSS
ncbi:MAG: hypothetical protein R3261_01975 [Alphaproteobacteria bacterium]|nr:hypothetical protein [Alphaproteobacteria bacterium]